MRKAAFMDVLTGVMCLLRTKGHAYGRMELSGRFGLKFPNQISNQIEVRLAMNLGATHEENRSNDSRASEWHLSVRDARVLLSEY